MIAGHHLNFPEKPGSDLRHWWHSILAGHGGRYYCYGFFLVLPSDKDAIDYMDNFTQELDLITGKNCLIIFINTTVISQRDQIWYVPAEPSMWETILNKLWKDRINRYVSAGHSLKIAEFFEIELPEFPCLVLFKDIRSEEHVVISLKGLSTPEISQRMREVFSRVTTAINKGENLLEALMLYNSIQNIREGQKIVGKGIKTVIGKTFDAAMEAIMKSIIK